MSMTIYEQAESAVLGRCLLDNSVLDDVTTPSNLFSQRNAIILDVMRRIHTAGGIVDVFTVLQTLETEYQGFTLAELGAMAESACPVSAVKARLEMIAENGRKMRVAKIAQSIMAMAHSPEHTSESLIDAAQTAFLAHDDESGCDGFIDIKDIAKRAINSIDERIERDGAPDGLQTKLADFDAQIGGLRGGELIIVAGRPGMGKTAFAMHLANEISVDCTAAIFALEMGELQTSYRLLSANSGVNMRRLTRENLTHEDWEAVTVAVSKISRLRQKWSFTDNPSVSQIRRMCAKLKRTHGLGLVVVDYLQLMEGDESASENRVNEIAKISRGLKRLAKSLNVPVIALSQLSRECEKRPDKKPVLSDLRDSGAIEQDADIVVGMWRPGHYWPDQSQNYCQAIVLKNRQGESGPVSLYCDMATQRFGNWAGEEPDDSKPVKRTAKFSMHS